MPRRKTSFNVNEDILICQTYLSISQDPITGCDQTRDHFWDRVLEEYNNAKEDTWEERTRRSISNRYAKIEQAVRKLCGCVRQIENMHRSGASTQDTLEEAKQLLRQDPNYQKGFKFDHVWALMKDFEKFKNVADVGKKKQRTQNYTNISSESEAATPNSPFASSPNLSSFSIHLDDDDVAGGSASSQRPSGVKKAKLKRPIDEAVKKVEYVSNRYIEAMNHAVERQKETNEIAKKKIEVKMLKIRQQEAKTMCIDLDSISDPTRREYIREEQRRILYNRSQESTESQPQQSSSPFTQYYNNFNAPGDDLGPY